MPQIELNISKTQFVPKFFPLLTDYSHRWECYMGSAGSAKSYFITQKLIIRACREKIKILVCRRYGTTIRNTCFSLFKDILAKWKLTPYVKIRETDFNIKFPNESEIIFMGLDEETKLLSLNNIGAIFIEEAFEVPKNIVEQLNLRLRGSTPNQQILMAWNPISQNHWLYDFCEINPPASFIDSEPHYFNQCPANIFMLSNDEKNIFDCIISLQDAYNELLSGEIDDYMAFCDAYLALEGVDAEVEDIAAMKENRVLILPTDARAEWLTKNSTDTQVENILKRTHDSIYRIAKCPDFSSETFVGGVSSGVAIRYRLTGCETKASAIESNMKKALQRRVELIAGVASLTLGEDVFRDIQITFTRNIPSDNTDVVNLVQALQGVVSNKTLLSMIPQVNDVDAEIEALEQERNEKIKIYDFEPANNVEE